MTLIPTEVICHAGYKAEEYPLHFLGMDGWVEVAEVVDRWYQGTRHPEWPESDYFRVRGDDDELHLLKHDREHNQWYLAAGDLV